IKYEDAINILGVTNRDLIFDLVDRMKAEKTEDVLVAIDEIIQSGKDVGQFIKDLIEHFRNLMVVKSSKSPELIIEVSNMDKYIEQSNLLDLDYILEALDILAEADSQAKWSSQPRIILEMATLKLINLNKSLSLEERIKRLEQGLGPTYKERDIPEGLEIKSGEDKMVEEEKKQPAFEDKEEKLVDKRIEPVKFKDDGGELDFDTINQEWPKVLQVINRKDVKTHAFLIEGEILSFRGNLLTIGYKEGFGFHQQAINTPKRKELVEKIVSEYFNRNIRINFVISNNMPKREEKKETSKHKAVKEVVDFFGEDIVEIK
ncbi:MAG TPA: DNA polymerase III subunit gamma/tau, partial [Tissierellaceae bacterium]|nr:DNA polymerase III subunit gamma/tau [Tissierellaceae bacterium]